MLHPPFLEDLPDVSVGNISAHHLYSPCLSRQQFAECGGKKSDIKEIYSLAYNAIQCNTMIYNAIQCHPNHHPTHIICPADDGLWQKKGDNGHFPYYFHFKTFFCTFLYYFHFKAIFLYFSLSFSF